MNRLPYPTGGPVTWLSLVIALGSLVSPAASATVEAFFNHSPHASYTEPYRGITRSGHDFESLIESKILSARQSVDAAVQELKLPKIAKALAKKHAEGIRVRIVLENAYRRPLSELSETEVAALDPYHRERFDEFVKLVDQDGDGKFAESEKMDRDALFILEKAGVPLIDDTADGSAGSGLMHHKFVVIDGVSTIVTSSNFTTSDVHGDFLKPESRGNRNALLVIENAAVAGVFTEEFNQLWSTKFGLKKAHRPPKVVAFDGVVMTIQFSPTSKTLGWAASVNGLIERELKRATNSVDIAQFVFSEQAFADALEKRVENGIVVRALIDPNFAFQYYSELYDFLGLKLLSPNCKFEALNRPWSQPIESVGIPRLPDGDKLHHKFAIIDGVRVLTGSHNWSMAANTQNDETFLVLQADPIIPAFAEEFEKLYAKAALGRPAWLLKKIADQEKKCGVTF